MVPLALLVKSRKCAHCRFDKKIRRPSKSKNHAKNEVLSHKSIYLQMD